MKARDEDSKLQEETRPFSETWNYDQTGCANRLENANMVPYKGSRGKQRMSSMSMA